MPNSLNETIPVRSWPAIRKVAVIGSGVMGGGIAAQVANAGVPVLLFDVTREVASAALARLLKSEPKPFMVEANAGLVTPLGSDHDMAELGSCDWIIEAVVERLDVKHAVYAAIARHASLNAIVSSNTSTMLLSDLLADTPETLRRRFLVTHFFNPPRHMRLVEIVKGFAEESIAARIADFIDMELGKTVVWCKDRPGFIANRLGCFWAQAAMATAYDMGIAVEEADAVMGKPFGIPKTGVFALMDLVGIDLIPHVNASLALALEPDDLFHRVNIALPFMDRMIAAGLTGRKGKGGFYRINRDKGRVMEAIDLDNLDYHVAVPVDIGPALSPLDEDSKLGRFARRVWALVFSYAAGLLGDAADDVASIDTAMRLGYNWQWGPFELMDRIGSDRVRQLIAAEALPEAKILRTKSFYTGDTALTSGGSYVKIARPLDILVLADIKSVSAPRLSNRSAALWNLGDGVAAFEITTKMNVIEDAVLDLLDQAIDCTATEFKALIIASDGPHTSAGFNLRQAMASIEAGDWPALESLLIKGQSTFKKLKYAPFPSVGAAHGLALGGGAELLLHCSAIEAHAEANIGLVECSVGLIPGWGGNGELLLRLGLETEPAEAVARAFNVISSSVVSRSAAEAQSMGLIQTGDSITMNRDRLIAAAKARALALTQDYRPRLPPVLASSGPRVASELMQRAEAARQSGKATDYDLVIAEALVTTLTGGGTEQPLMLSEREFLAIERDRFMSLVRRPETWARIVHTLETGKPLRN